jgi:hypothetical protein
MNLIDKILGGDPFDDHDKAADLLVKLNAAHLDGNYFENWQEPALIETPEELARLGFMGPRDYLDAPVMLGAPDPYPSWYFLFEREALNDYQVMGIEGFVLFDHRVLVTEMASPRSRSGLTLFKNGDDFVAHVKANNG